MNVAALRRDPQYGSLKDYILVHTGLSYYSDKDEDFATRLSRRLSARSTASCDRYLRLLTSARTGREEMDLLVGELTIGETYFFRQREHFELLRATILPDILARRQGSRTLKVWSAGCATGAEPYSISILLQLEFLSRLAGWDVDILATDINVDFIARAQQARFADWALRDTSDSIKQRCFIHEAKTWLLRPEFRKNVRFRYQNLASGVDFGGPFDLILCRNVLIYFSREQTEAVLDGFYRALSPGGWLLVGYAESNMEMFTQFETVTTRDTTAYRKSDGERTNFGFATDWQPHVFDESAFPKEKVTPARSSSTAVTADKTISKLQATLDDVRVLADSGQWKDAASLARELVRSDALNPANHFTLALIHEHLGAIDKAREAFRRAIYLDRNFALAHYHLGTSLTSTREVELAGRAFRNALDILTSMPQDEPLAHGDSITAGELRALTIMHLNMSGQ